MNKSLCLLMLIVPFCSSSSGNIEEVLVEGGDYYIGSVFGNADYVANTNTTISDFYIMNTEVTYSIYHTIYKWAKMNKYDFNEGCNGASFEDCLPPGTDQDLHPVTNIDWLDAIIFANAMSEFNNLKPVYLSIDNLPIRMHSSVFNVHLDLQADGFRLPTIDEWQLAARGGRPALDSGAYGFIHSGDNNAKNVAWYPDYNNKNFGTQKVGLLAPNILGLYDMSGNVSEWVYDSINVQEVKMYYFCGGSYLFTTPNLASCDTHSAGFSMPDIGFRLVRNIPS